MLIFNTTLTVEHDIHDEWLLWMKQVHIPDVMKTGKFIDQRMCRLLGVDETDGFTYSLQLTSPDRKAFERFQEEDAYALQKIRQEKYDTKVLSFSTLMEKV
ncbi:MAG: DUF4286 family protein [Saprospiraceae bacterium]|nr:DUF4286 family protein [Saprospiraceae bacterium]